jgi:hypothetical protein
MIFLLAAFIPLAFCVRSMFLILWRFNKEQKFLAWKHLIIFILAGIVSLCVIFVEAMGAMAHYVPSDTDVIIDNLVMWFASICLILSLIGSLIAIVKGIIYLRRS